MDYIVHFTTTPGRFFQLKPTISSLLEQTPTPKHIIVSIHVPAESASVDQDTRLRAELTEKYKGLITLHFLTKDMGPSTKIYGILHYFKENGITKDYPSVLICDDDIIYHPSLVKNYSTTNTLSESRPGVLTQFRPTRGEPERLLWTNHLQGSDTYLLPPSFFEKTSLTLYDNYLNQTFNQCPATFYQDDYIICYFIYFILGFCIRTPDVICTYTQRAVGTEGLSKHPKVNEREFQTITYFNKKIEAFIDKVGLRKMRK